MKADNKPTHRLLMAYERIIKNGSTTTTKTGYAEVCGLWKTEKGGLSGEIPQGMTISGRLVIVAADSSAAEPEAPPAAAPVSSDALSDH